METYSVIVLRCSSLDRALSCPGSIQLEPACPSSPDSDESLEGTFLHYLAHIKLRQESNASGELTEPKKCPENIQLSAWIADYYARFVRQTAPPSWSLEMEAEYEGEFPLARPVHGITSFRLTGHPDDIAINPEVTEAIGFDLKAGYDPVDPAEYNEQVFGYAILLLDAYPTLRKITYYIVQPRNDEDTGYRRVSEPMVLERSRLLAARATFINRINTALENWWETGSGPKQCKWCNVARVRPWLCPSLKADVTLLNTMKAKFDKKTIQSMKGDISDTELGDFVCAGRMLTEPVKAATEVVHERIDKQGYLDCGNGKRYTRKISGGAYNILDVPKYNAQLLARVGQERFMATVQAGMEDTRDAIAAATGLPKTSEKGDSAQKVVDAEFKTLCQQADKKTLILS